MRYLNTRNNTKYIKAGAFVLMRWFPNYFFHIISISGEREIGTTLTASNGDTSMNMPLPSANPNLTVLVDNHSNSSSLVFSPTNDALTSSGITKIYSSDINYAIVPAGTRMMFELKVYYDGTDKILYIKNNKCTLMWDSS